MDTYQFILEFEVRDYECDFQGIVNNSVYFNYLEHTRHTFAKHVGLDVVALAQRGINLVVVRAELVYKHPLKSGDHFLVGTNLVRHSRLRQAFHHTIVHRESGSIMLTACIITAAINAQGKPFLPDELSRLFQ